MIDGTPVLLAGFIPPMIAAIVTGIGGALGIGGGTGAAAAAGAASLWGAGAGAGAGAAGAVAPAAAAAGAGAGALGGAAGAGAGTLGGVAGGTLGGTAGGTLVGGGVGGGAGGIFGSGIGASLAPATIASVETGLTGLAISGATTGIQAAIGSPNMPDEFASELPEGRAARATRLNRIKQRRGYGASILSPLGGMSRARLGIPTVLGPGR